MPKVKLRTYKARIKNGPGAIGEVVGVNSSGTKFAIKVFPGDDLDPLFRRLLSLIAATWPAPITVLVDVEGHKIVGIPGS